MIKKAEQFANKKLQDFKDAAQKDDKKRMADLVKDVLKLLKSVERNNNKLLSTIDILTNAVKFTSDRELDGWFWSRLLHFVVSAIDGNRDNYSYYMFDGCSKWIERRVGSVKGDLKDRLDNSRKLIIDARDDLDSHAQIFVQGIKKIRELSSDGKAGKNADEIRAVVETFQKMKKTIRLREKTTASIQSVEDIIKSL